jgi:hypothetical protein
VATGLLANAVVLVVNVANAPVNKAVTLLTVGLTVGAWLFDASRSMTLTPAGLRHMQLWRLVLHHFVFGSVGELLFGLIMMHQFRMFERQMGSSKFATFASVSAGISTLVATAAGILLVPSMGLTTTSMGAGTTGSTGAAAAAAVPFGFSGPYGLLFACLAQYVYDVPASYRFKVLGLPLSDKLFLYLVAAQLLLTNAPTSLLAGVAGFVAGCLWRVDSLGMQHWRYPRWLTTLAARYLWPLVASSSSSSSSARARARDGTPHWQPIPGTGIPTVVPQPPGSNSVAAAGIDGGAGALPMQQQQQQQQHGDVVPQVPTEDNIQALTSMGFDRGQAHAILVQTGNNLQLAIHLLLDS